MTFDGREPACHTPADRVRACLCEAGYPSAIVEDEGLTADGRPEVSVQHDAAIPPAVLYQAFRVSRIALRCFDHWFAGAAHSPETCEGCTNWSPPRELLLSA